MTHTTTTVATTCGTMPSIYSVDSVKNPNRINSKLLASILLLTILSIGYTWIFMGSFLSSNDAGFGFTRLLIPDTFFYRRLVFDGSDPVNLIFIGAKNFIGPALLWMSLNGDWYLAAFVNIAMLSYTVLLLSRIGNHLRISISNKIIIFLVLLPETFIYSIGVNKEIPTLLFFSAIAYSIIRKNWLAFFVCFILLILFRYQFFWAVTLGLLGYFAFGRKNVRFLILTFLILTSMYPLLIQYVADLGELAGAAKSYREAEPGLGVGAVIESIQSEWYGLSSVATLVRLFQMLIEPWPTPRFLEENNISILIWIWSISSVILLPIWFRYFRIIFFAFRYPSRITRDESVILSLSFAFVMMVAMNAFIHHRYLYPGLGLIILTAYFPVSARVPVKKKLVSAGIS